MKRWVAILAAAVMVVVTFLTMRDFQAFSQGKIGTSLKRMEQRDHALYERSIDNDVAPNSSSRMHWTTNNTGALVATLETKNSSLNSKPRIQIEATRAVTSASTLLAGTEGKVKERVESTYDSIWNETAWLLFQDSDHLDEMLAQRPLSVYVYDTLSKFFDIHNISRCIYEKFQPHTPRSNCRWEPKVCKEVQTDATPKALYSSYRNNYNHDVAIIQLFQNYPGRVMDPSKADIFVVPYPHKSHCLCTKDLSKRIAGCQYPDVEFRDNIISNLPYYNASSLDRHLFIQGVDWNLAVSHMKDKPLVLTLGDARPCVGKASQAPPCGAMVVPYLNTNPEYQPKYLASLSEEWWTTRPRLYSVGAVMGRKKVLKERMQFLNETEEILGGSSLGGLPIHVINLRGVRKLARQDEAMEIYRNSTVCPILAGDGCPQKRVFDVMMSGCIPVVFNYATSNEKGWPSWFKSGACSIRVTYPFAKGTFSGDAKAGIDWESLVIPINGTCGFACMKSTIEAVMQDTDRLTELRRRLHKVATLFSYGLEAEANGSMDAFSALLVSLKHYVVKLQ